MQTKRPHLFSTAPAPLPATPARPAAARDAAERSSRGATAAMRSGRSARGFTMLELMTVVAIAGILAAVGAPGMLEFIRANRLSTVARQLDADILLARREAIKRNARVLVCPAEPSANTCRPSAGYVLWAKGWVVCYDNNSDDQCDTGTTENPNPIRKNLGLDATLTLTGPLVPLRFNANGSQGAAGAATATFTTGGSWTGAKTYIESITATGNVSLAKGS